MRVGGGSTASDRGRSGSRGAIWRFRERGGLLGIRALQAHGTARRDDMGWRQREDGVHRRAVRMTTVRTRRTLFAMRRDDVLYLLASCPGRGRMWHDVQTSQVSKPDDQRAHHHDGGEKSAHGRRSVRRDGRVPSSV